MRQSADHALGGSAGQFGVGIEGQNKADTRKQGEITNLDRKTVVLIAQKLVQVKEFAALPLPAHPHPFAGIENAVAVEQEKGSHAVAVSVLGIQLGDQFCREIDQRV